MKAKEKITNTEKKLIENTIRVNDKYYGGEHIKSVGPILHRIKDGKKEFYFCVEFIDTYGELFSNKNVNLVINEWIKVRRIKNEFNITMGVKNVR